MRTNRVLLFLLFFTVLTFTGAKAFAGNDFNVTMTTNPTAKNIGPDVNLVKTTLTVTDGKGQVVPGVYLKFYIHSPKKNVLFSTDFPWVEDTHLLDYEGYLNNGTWTFDYIYPIRGSYRIEARAGLDPSSLSDKILLPLSIAENRVEFNNLLVFLAILFVFGIVAGWVIGRGVRLVPAVLVLGLSLSVAYVSAGPVYANHPHNHDQHYGTEIVEPLQASMTEATVTLGVAMNPGAGKVGTLNHITLTAKDSAGRLIPNTVFDIKLWHIEDDKPVFSTSLFGEDGQAGLSFQFFDGAEHDLRITARSPQGMVQWSQVVEVEGLNPPTAVKVKTTAYFAAMTLIGMALGLRLQKRGV